MIFGFELTVIFVMLLLNAVFAAYEMALASLSRARIAFWSKSTKRRARSIFMKDRMEASFAIIQLGITLVGALVCDGQCGVAEVFAPYLVTQWGSRIRFGDYCPDRFYHPADLCHHRVR